MRSPLRDSSAHAACSARLRMRTKLYTAAAKVNSQSTRRLPRCRSFRNRPMVLPRLGIGRRGMRVVAPSLAVKIHRRIAGVIRWRRHLVLALEALESGPGLEQRAVHREVLARQQAAPPGLRDDLLKERHGDLAVKQTLAILGEDRGIPHESSMFRPTNHRKSRL